MQGLHGLDSSFVDRWRAVAQLKAFQLPGKQVQAAPSRLAARSEEDTHPPLPNAQPCLRWLRHSVHLGWWHLRISLSNQGSLDFRQVSGSLLHPSLRLQSHGSTLALLRPVESGELTVSIPLAAVVQPTHLDVDVTISWRASPSSAAAAVSHSERHGGGKAGGDDRWPWQHRVITRVRIDGKALFESALLTHSAEAALPTEHLPPTLSRSLSLVVDVPPEAALCSICQGCLRCGWAPFAPPASVAMRDNSGGSGVSSSEQASGSPKNFSEISMGCLSRSSAGLEVSLFAVGGCAELELTASGADTDAVLVSVASTLRTALPKSARVRLCYASGRALHALRRASLALQAELWLCSVVLQGSRVTRWLRVSRPCQGRRFSAERDRHGNRRATWGFDECVIVPCTCRPPCSCCRVCTGHLYRLITLRRPVETVDTTHEA